MERFPVIITIGGGLLGFVAGEMLVSDPALDGCMRSTFEYGADNQPLLWGMHLGLLAGLVGAALVVGRGQVPGEPQSGARTPWSAPRRAETAGSTDGADACATLRNR